MTPIKKIFKAAAVVSAAALLITGCSQTGGEAGGGAASPETINWTVRANNLFNGHFDPHKSQIDASEMIGRLSLDSLTYLDDKGELHPWLAKSWETSEDGKTVTFKLRDDVTFHDGEKFNAEAVKANFEHIMAEETDSAQANLLLGGEAYEGTEVVDDYTVAVKFSRPNAPFLNNTSRASLGFYSPKALQAGQDKLSAGGADVTVGTGPWKLTKLESGTSISYERNADYKWAPQGYDLSKNLAKQLEVSVVPDDELRVKRLSSGETDVVSEVTPNSADSVEEGLHSQPSPGIPYSYYLNQANGHLADQKVRQALVLGANIDEAVKAVYSDHVDRAWSALAPNTPNTTGDKLEGVNKFDRARAEQLLDEAGWVRPADGVIREKGGNKLELSYIAWTPRSDENQTLSELLIADWKEIGIDVKYEVLEPEQYNALYEPGKYDITDWGYSSTDADILRNHLHSEGFQNAPHVQDPEIDAKIDAAAATFDAAERTRIYDELLQWNADQVYILPIHQNSKTTAVSSKVTGLEYDAFGYPQFFNVGKK
ncbi:ABC transporter substrate-binding protein [Leucobacter sp. OH1287]|uniref:ABC transporter substrate-binding protein n=1 Tax=Leucobacter sp. OH1287 TaxID=2491049 RepID=UPI000F5EBCB5|nr:ABC transporter substrate-binding protein [Leucobacter sp. OH1287]RRD60971.1 ABC transporter substrate-binding protein [Leucobacter sp. OH1287]